MVQGATMVQVATEDQVEMVVQAADISELQERRCSRIGVLIFQD